VERGQAARARQLRIEAIDWVPVVVRANYTPRDSTRWGKDSSCGARADQGTGTRPASEIAVHTARPHAIGAGLHHWQFYMVTLALIHPLGLIEIRGRRKAVNPRVPVSGRGTGCMRHHRGVLVCGRGAGCLRPRSGLGDATVAAGPGELHVLDAWMDSHWCLSPRKAMEDVLFALDERFTPCVEGRL